VVLARRGVEAVFTKSHFRCREASREEEKPVTEHGVD
jgi:hypothetical protein